MTLEEYKEKVREFLLKRLLEREVQLPNISIIKSLGVSEGSPLKTLNTLSEGLFNSNKMLFSPELVMLTMAESQI